MSKRKVNAVAHHIMLPCCEYVGESAGDSKSQKMNSEELTGSSCLTSSSSSVSCEETSVSGTCNQKDEDVDTCWTDDKHSSYISCMEEMFVRNLYDREYCSLEICGESASACEQDCVESKLPSDYFKVMKGGGWQPLPCRRLHSWEIPSPELMSSPWIQHFTARTVKAEDVSSTRKLICKTSTAYEIEDDDDAAEVPDMENRSSAWFDRINRPSIAGTSTSTRATSPAAAAAEPTQKALPRKFDPVDQVVPLAKKIKRWDSESENQQQLSSRMNLVRRRYNH